MSKSYLVKFVFFIHFESIAPRFQCVHISKVLNGFGGISPHFVFKYQMTDVLASISQEILK